MAHGGASQASQDLHTEAGVFSQGVHDPEAVLDLLFPHQEAPNSLPSPSLSRMLPSVQFSSVQSLSRVQLFATP